jgi:hypothetical protein
MARSSFMPLRRDLSPLICLCAAAAKFGEANRAARRHQQQRAYFGVAAGKVARADDARPPLWAPGRKSESVTFKKPFREKGPATPPTTEKSKTQRAKFTARPHDKSSRLTAVYGPPCAVCCGFDARAREPARAQREETAGQAEICGSFSSAGGSCREPRPDARSGYSCHCHLRASLNPQPKQGRRRYILAMGNKNAFRHRLIYKRDFAAFERFNLRAQLGHPHDTQRGFD